MIPTPRTDSIRDQFRGHDAGLCRALIAHSNDLERELHMAKEEAAHLRDVLSGCNKNCDYLRSELKRYQQAFRHVHVGPADKCASCGLDLRDEVHTRYTATVKPAGHKPIL